MRLPPPNALKTPRNFPDNKLRLIRGSAAFIIAIAMVASITVVPKKAYGQTVVGEVLAIAGEAKTVFDGLKTAYDMWKLGQSLAPNELTTADQIINATNSIISLIVTTDARLIKDNGAFAFWKYNFAVQYPSSSTWRDFDSYAKSVIYQIEDRIENASEREKYAHDLGALYTILVPLYLGVHLHGYEFGLDHLPGNTTYHQDFIRVAKKALKISYDMVGAKVVLTPNSQLVPSQNSTRRSLLYKHIKKGIQAPGCGSMCFTDDRYIDFNFQTDPTVQAVQKGAAALYDLLKDDEYGLNSFLDGGQFTLLIDPAASWANNWQGYDDAVWTNTQMYSYGSYIGNSKCPLDSRVVGIWQIHRYEVVSFLCQKSPCLSTQLPTGSQDLFSDVPITCSNGWCSTGYFQCPGEDFAIGSYFNGNTCINRAHYGTGIIRRGVCDEMDAWWGFNGHPEIPYEGGFTALPVGTYLTGMSIQYYYFGQDKGTYFYCNADCSPALLPPAPVPTVQVSALQYTEQVSVSGEPLNDNSRCLWYSYTGGNGTMSVGFIAETSEGMPLPQTGNLYKSDYHYGVGDPVDSTTNVPWYTVHNKPVGIGGEEQYNVVCGLRTGATYRLMVASYNGPSNGTFQRSYLSTADTGNLATITIAPWYWPPVPQVPATPRVLTLGLFLLLGLVGVRRVAKTNHRSANKT